MNDAHATAARLQRELGEATRHVELAEADLGELAGLPPDPPEKQARAHQNATALLHGGHRRRR